MLSQLRDASKTWIAGVFILLLVGSFAIWGVDDVFRTQTDRTIATVGSVDIEAPDLLREFERMRQQLAGEGNPPLPTEQALQFGLDRLALDQLLGRTVLDEKARELGLTTADETLAREIRANEAFQGPTGRFDDVIYRQILAANRLTRAMFEDRLRSDLTRTQLVDAVADGVQAPRALASLLYDYREENRRVTYVVIPTETIGELGEPEDTELESLHAAEIFRFTAPEYRAFTFLALRPSDLVETVEVDEERIRAEYDFRRESFREPESRSVRQIVFNDRADAEAAATRLEDGASITDIAADQGLSETDIDLGDLTRDDFFDPAMADGVFALTEPGLTPVIDGSLGLVIAEVTAINPGKEQSFEEVRDDLRQEVALEAAADAVNDLIEQVEDARAGGQTLEEIGNDLKLNVVRVEPVSRTGQRPSGTPADNLPPEPSILANAFASEEGVENPFEALDDGGYFVVRLDTVTPSAPKPFDSVRAEVKTLWIGRRQASLLEEKGTAVARRVKEGETFETVAAEFDGRVITPVDPIGRTATDDVLSTAVLADLFKAADGAVVTGAAANGQGQVVARVTEIVAADASTADAAVQAIRSTIDQSLSTDIVQGLVAILREDYEVVVNDRAVAQALGQSADGVR